MLARRDPFREISDMSDTFDRFVNRFWDDMRWGGSRWYGGNLPLDIAETGEAYVVKASIPGLDPDDLDITFSNNMLTIKGEVKKDREVDESHYYLKERWFGEFQRSLTLPAKVDTENIKADYAAGVLTLTLPKSEEVKPKRIQVKSASRPKLVEGKAKEVK